MTILQMTDRKADIRIASPGGYVKQRIADASDALSLAGSMAARVELCNEALFKLVELCYELDSDGLCCNVDIVTYRILIPLPWGSSGWKRWHLRYHEALVMRAIMLGRQGVKPGHPLPLFTYDSDSRTWSLNVYDYPTPKRAQAWLQASQITLGEWRRHLRQWRTDAATTKRQRRTAMQDSDDLV